MKKFLQKQEYQLWACGLAAFYCVLQIIRLVFES